MQASAHGGWKRTFIGLLLFGVAFGYLEAAVVVYLRTIHEPARQRYHPGRPPGDLFPLLTLEQIRDAGPTQRGVLPVEIGREAATLVMLAAVALVSARNAGQWLAAFAVAFGTWDITFYLFLKSLLGWPASLMTWDVLFLIPVPWVAPVLAPVIVSGSMIAAGLWHLRRESERPVRLTVFHWAGLVLGAAVIVLSFTLDCRNIMAGGRPSPFNWWVFGAGEAIGSLSYFQATRRLG